MRLTVLLCALALLRPPHAPAQEPPKPPASGGIDATIDRIAELRRQRAELDKQEQAAVGELKVQLKSLNDRLDRLGVLGPPPKPPEPAPPKPDPPDPLRAKLKAAFDADPAPASDRRAQALDLAALYRAAAALARDEACATSGELLGRVTEAAGRLLADPPGGRKLAAVRKAAAAELAAVLPTDAPLAPGSRAAAAALFERLAAALDELAR